MAEVRVEVIGDSGEGGNGWSPQLVSASGAGVPSKVVDGEQGFRVFRSTVPLARDVRPGDPNNANWAVTLLHHGEGQSGTCLGSVSFESQTPPVSQASGKVRESEVVSGPQFAVGIRRGNTLQLFPVRQVLRLETLRLADPAAPESSVSHVVSDRLRHKQNALSLLKTECFRHVVSADVSSLEYLDCSPRHIEAFVPIGSAKAGAKRDANGAAREGSASSKRRSEGGRSASSAADESASASASHRDGFAESVAGEGASGASSLAKLAATQVNQLVNVLGSDRQKRMRMRYANESQAVFVSSGTAISNVLSSLRQGDSSETPGGEPFSASSPGRAVPSEDANVVDGIPSHVSQFLPRPVDLETRDVRSVYPFTSLVSDEIKGGLSGVASTLAAAMGPKLEQVHEMLYDFPLWIQACCAEASPSGNAANPVDANAPARPMHSKRRLSLLLALLFFEIKLFACRYRRFSSVSDLESALDAPTDVCAHLLTVFAAHANGTYSFPRESTSRMLCHIAVLSLHCSSFSVDPRLLCHDLKFSSAHVLPHFDLVGCRPVKDYHSETDSYLRLLPLVDRERDNTSVPLLKPDAATRRVEVSMRQLHAPVKFPAAHARIARSLL